MQSVLAELPDTEAESLGHARCYGSHGGLLLLELHGDQTHVELLLELE